MEGKRPWIAVAGGTLLCGGTIERIGMAGSAPARNIAWTFANSSGVCSNDTARMRRDPFLRQGVTLQPLRGHHKVTAGIAED